MTYRPAPKYASKDAKQGSWCTCDRCGLLDSQSRMQFQYDFLGGLVPQNTGYLVCMRCLDALQFQNQPIIIPPDPPPLFNTRPENYTVDETDWLTSGDNYDGDIITTGVTSDSGNALIRSQPNPADNGDTAVLILTASLSYAGTLSVSYLDLFNGNPANSGASILATITESATRSNVFAQLTANDNLVLLNPAVITITAAASAIANVTHVGIYSAASGGTLLVSGPVGATAPTIVAGATVQFNALGLAIAQG